MGVSLHLTAWILLVGWLIPSPAPLPPGVIFTALLDFELPSILSSPWDPQGREFPLRLKAKFQAKMLGFFFFSFSYFFTSFYTLVLSLQSGLHTLAEVLWSPTSSIKQSRAVWEQGCVT